MRHKTGILFSEKDSELIQVFLTEKAWAIELDKIDRRNQRLQKQDIVFLVIMGIAVISALIIVFVHYLQQFG